MKIAMRRTEPVSQVTLRMRSQRQAPTDVTRVSATVMRNPFPPFGRQRHFFSYNVCLFSILSRSGWFLGFKGWSLCRHGMTSGLLSSYAGPYPKVGRPYKMATVRIATMAYRYRKQKKVRFNMEVETPF